MPSPPPSRPPSTASARYRARHRIRESDSSSSRPPQPPSPSSPPQDTPTRNPALHSQLENCLFLFHTPLAAGFPIFPSLLPLPPPASILISNTDTNPPSSNALSQNQQFLPLHNMPPTTTTSTDPFLPILHGTWSLLSLTATSTSSNPPTVIHPLGPSPLGTLLYSPSGHMTSLVQTSTLPNFTSWNAPTPSEALSTVHATQCYSGPFYISASYPAIDNITKNDLGDGINILRRTVYHDVKVALPPNWKGMVMKRLMTLTKDTAGKWTLSVKVEEEVDMGKMAGEGGKYRIEVKFEKVEEVDSGQGLPPGVAAGRLS